MSRVAIVTDTAADLAPEEVAAHAITVVPLTVTFGDQTFRAGEDLTNEAFWERMLAPGAPFPKTAAPGAGAMQAAFEARFREGADALVCVTLSGSLSATHGSAMMARAALPEREIHVVDTRWATYPEGMLVVLAAEMAAAGRPAAAIADAVRGRIPDLRAFIALETLEYLKRGGRISGARAALGTVLSVKPIVTVVNGEMEPVDRVRTRSRARARLVELVGGPPAERLAVMHSMAQGIDEFVDDIAAALDFEPSLILRRVIGPTIGPHVGPGAVGVVVLARVTPAIVG
jgi:DegV family protein with EDD domain